MNLSGIFDHSNHFGLLWSEVKYFPEERLFKELSISGNIFIVPSISKEPPIWVLPLGVYTVYKAVLYCSWLCWKPVELPLSCVHPSAVR